VYGVVYMYTYVRACCRPLVLTHRQFTRLNVFIAPNNVTQVNERALLKRGKDQATGHDSLTHLPPPAPTATGPQGDRFCSLADAVAEFIKMQLLRRSQARLKKLHVIFRTCCGANGRSVLFAANCRFRGVSAA
jgi:hypothetical protein